MHKNFKFLGLANQLLTQYIKYSNENNNSYETEANLLQAQLKNALEENRKLQLQIKNKEIDRHESDLSKKNYQAEFVSFFFFLIVINNFIKNFLNYFRIV